MPGYWWECSECHVTATFEKVVGKGPVIFLWDDLSVDWDQSKLLKKCSQCGNETVRMTFKFPRKNEVTLTVVHIVGLTPDPQEDDYLPMLWETKSSDAPNERWFHFNYQGRRSNLGLNRPAILVKGDLKKLSDLYFEKTGAKLNLF